ncbi:MAG: hypothetical protein IJH12_07675 [Clostridia bacterium]|nr:hypothetical protein [Clostridia bacterium]
MRDKIFAVSISIILLLVPISILIRKDKDISLTENRALFKKSDIELTALNEGINQWLEDQFIGGDTLKKMYNRCKNKTINVSMKLIEKSNLINLIPMGKGIYRLANTDYMVYKLAEFDEFKDTYGEIIDSINHVYNQNSSVDFYVYNIVTDDIVIGREKYDELFRKRLDKNIKFMSSTKINTYDDYKKSFYKTDHHWDKDGQYDGYVDIMHLLGQEDIEEKPRLLKFDNLKFWGSKARAIGDTEIYDEFEAYDYSYPEMSVQINFQEVPDYGDEENFASGNIIRDVEFENYYADFYGSDYGIVNFCVSDNEECENILVLSNSYSNAINKLIASKFYNTYIVDMRYYESQLNESFNINEFIKNNDITKVLVIGNHMYYKNIKFKID